MALLQGVANMAYTVGGQPVSTSLQAVATYAAQQLGTIDVPSGTPSGTPFALSLGSISAPKGYYIQAGFDAKVAFNGATGAPISVASGGFIAAAAPASVAAAPLQSILVITTATADGLKTLAYAVFGD